MNSDFFWEPSEAFHVQSFGPKIERVNEIDITIYNYSPLWQISGEERAFKSPFFKKLLY
jgi:hypothetical protein